MTFTYERDLKIRHMYLHATDELSVKASTVRAVHRQTDRQTTERITTLHSRMGIYFNKHIKKFE